MPRLRIGIRLKLLFLSLFLFAIPWLGYQYVWELESYLRAGQEQTMVGTARAVATALHERPSLFDSQAAFLQDVKPGTDLYAHKIARPIQLDGKLGDWSAYQDLMLDYGEAQLLNARTPYQPDSLAFSHMVGQYRQFLYAMFSVEDDTVLFRPTNSLRIDRNDHLLIAMTRPDGAFVRYLVTASGNGWVSAYLLDNSVETISAVKPENRIQGHWQTTDSGYNIELRFPLEMMSGQIAFAIVDIDDSSNPLANYIMGTADPAKSDSLGTVLVPSPEIENILRGLQYSNARVWVVDKHMRVLAKSGSIQSATGIQASNARSPAISWWQKFEQKILLPIYYQILTRPPADFVDELENAYSLEGSALERALQGQPDSLWRLSPDNLAVILSAAHPIFIDEHVMGAVVVEQTTHGIRTLRNRALEQLFHVILAVVVLGTLALFVFASRISFRIRNLRNETENAIDGSGKIVKNIQPSRTRDEIGDLSRTFHGVLDKLGQYNAYLENMGSRLSHELRTPVAVVNSSLENLALHQPDDHDSRQYIERAQQGIKRLSTILANMSEATRLEQALQINEREAFHVDDVVCGCTEGYKLAYPAYRFVLDHDGCKPALQGSPDLFAQMLDKIVANAVEFSDTQNDIVIGLVKKGTGFTISIANQGPLLPQDMQDQLLDSMVSVRSGSDSDKPHLGLGLYIAKLIAEYHGGQVSLANLEDKTGVTVTLNFY